MGRRYLEKLKNIRKATVEDRVGIENKMNIRDCRGIARAV